MHVFFALSSFARPWMLSIDMKELVVVVVYAVEEYAHSPMLPSLAGFSSKPTATSMNNTLGITKDSLGSEKFEGRRGLLRLSLMAPCEAPCM